MQPSLLFIDETFDTNNCSNYKLSIQCSLDGFSFSVFDTLLHKFIVLADYYLICASSFQLKNEIANILNNHEIIVAGFKHVSISYITHKNIISPNALTEKNEETIFTFTFEKERNDEIINNSLLNGKSLLSAIPVILKDYFLSYFNNVTFFSPCYPMADRVNTKSPIHPTLHLQKHNHVLYILGTSEHEFKVLNTYYVKNENDILYFTLRLAKSLGFDNNTNIILSGAFDQGTVTQKELIRYFKTVSFARLSSRYSVSYTFMKKHEHIYLSLMELALCE